LVEEPAAAGASGVHKTLRGSHFAGINPRLLSRRAIGRKGNSTVNKKYRSASRDDLKNPDYSHIKRDLRRILVIAGSFVAAMIVLAFILR
jgi:hypothetical protein